MSAVVLAGGRSVRMGRDKRRIEVRGRSLLRRAVDTVAPLADEILVSCRAGDPPALDGDGPSVRLVFDERGEGPIAGIEAALRAAAHDWLLAIPVDMPGLRADVLARLGDALSRRPNAQAVVFELGGRPLPLPMLVHRRTLPALSAQLDSGDYRVLHFLEAVEVAVVALEPAEAAELTRNANSPDDLSGLAGLSEAPPEASA